MPHRSRTRPSAVRTLVLGLAIGLPTIGLLAACGSVTPTSSAAPAAPTAADSPPSSPGSTTAPPSPTSSPTDSPTPTLPPGPGITWRRVAIPGVPATMERLAIGPERMVVAVDSQALDGTPTGRIAFWSSVDTVTWVAATQVPSADDGIVTAVVAIDRGFIAVGSDATSKKPQAWTSTDGRQWALSPEIERGAAGATAAAMTSVATGPDGSIVAGGFADAPGRRFAIAWTSHDGGETWHPAVVDGTGARAQIQGVARGGPGWVATGIRDAAAAFWLSRDGLAWVHVVPRPPVGGGFGMESSADAVACAANRCVAVGQGPSAGDGWAWWSDEPDGWNTVHPADALAGGASRSVVAFHAGFAAGGAGSDGRFGIWTTTDGHRWTASPPVGGPGAIVADLAADGSRIVAVGSPFDGGTGFAVWIGSAAP
jgi:hypothetical protein